MHGYLLADKSVPRRKQISEDESDENREPRVTDKGDYLRAVERPANKGHFVQLYLLNAFTPGLSLSLIYLGRTVKHLSDSVNVE